MATSTRKTHPALTPRRIADLSNLARKIDREEAAELKAEGREILFRQENIRKITLALKQARLAKNLSLAEVGDRAGIDKANLSRLENHPTPNPTLETLLRYADAVGVKMHVSISA